MPTCTFFGHRECPETIKRKLRDVLIDLITNHRVDMFYVGNQGQYDTIVRKVLRELKEEYPQINYAVVLAYLPCNNNEFELYDYSETIYPEGIEKAIKRYAINYRNRWMIKQSDIIISYINDIIGGAVSAVQYAKKQGLEIINITEAIC